MPRNRIAVTGGIGSGKTAVLKILAEWGYPVYSCDEISHRLWTEESYLKTLAAAFPDCTTEGRVDKGKLSALIFSKETERKRLESVSHPVIMRELMEKMEREPVCFAEVPLLFECGYESLFDGVLLVRRREKDRIAAVIKRDNITSEAAMSRIASQFTDDLRQKEGVVVVENNGTTEELKENVKAALRFLGV